jgi:hypothetical protein
MEILTFMIEGRGESHVGYNVAAADNPEVEAKLIQQARTDEFVWKMNKRADEIAQTIEREVRRLMSPGGGISVQADISFYSGSFILEGSVVLLLWAGRTALEPIRDELANAIKTVTRRVVNGAITAFNAQQAGNDYLGRMTVEVTSVPPPPTSAAIATAAPSPGVPQAPLTQVGQSGILQDQRWLIVLVGILTVLVLILLADRLLTSSLPRNVYITPAPTASPGAAPPK